jgi:predicted adenine nucleotide alpha hydrolase (AANH) superfamily ATPase
VRNKPRLLLHVCCAPCCTYPITALQDEFDVELFFYNPNIQPEEEYKARLDEAGKYTEKIGIGFHEAPYEVDAWFRATSGLQGEPEGGDRCEICYRMRLGKTAQFAAANGFDYFATTLSISPHKDSDMINMLGGMIADMYALKFYSADFKKNDGFKKSAMMSKEAGLYRQNYCGCKYSKKS